MERLINTGIVPNIDIVNLNNQHLHKEQALAILKQNIINVSPDDKSVLALLCQILCVALRSKFYSSNGISTGKTYFDRSDQANLSIKKIARFLKNLHVDNAVDSARALIILCTHRTLTLSNLKESLFLNGVCSLTNSIQKFISSSYYLDIPLNKLTITLENIETFLLNPQDNNLDSAIHRLLAVMLDKICAHRFENLDNHLSVLMITARGYADIFTDNSQFIHQVGHGTNINPAFNTIYIPNANAQLWCIDTDDQRPVFNEYNLGNADKIAVTQQVVGKELFMLALNCALNANRALGILVNRQTMTGRTIWGSELRNYLPIIDIGNTSTLTAQLRASNDFDANIVGRNIRRIGYLNYSIDSDNISSSTSANSNER